MKPFDLEAAKRGEPIVRRDGTPAKFIAHVPEAIKRQRVIVLIDDVVHSTYESGRSHDLAEQKADLFMAPKKRTVWVNLYGGPLATYHESLQEADASHFGLWSPKTRLGNRAYRLEIEE